MNQPPPGNRSLRKGRHSSGGLVYLVTTCCRAKEPIFLDLALGRVVIEEIYASDLARRSTTYDFVVMPDHFHWLFQLGMRESISATVRKVKGRSSLRINRLRAAAGAVWQRGFHEHAIRQEESLESVGAYVVQNPVRAGLVRHADDYLLWDVQWKRRTSWYRG